MKLSEVVRHPLFDPRGDDIDWVAGEISKLEDRISILEQRCKRRGEKLARQAEQITRLETSRKTLREIVRKH